MMMVMINKPLWPSFALGLKKQNLGGLPPYNLLSLPTISIYIVCEKVAKNPLNYLFQIYSCYLRGDDELLNPRPAHIGAMANTMEGDIGTMVAKQSYRNNSSSKSYRNDSSSKSYRSDICKEKFSPI